MIEYKVLISFLLIHWLADFALQTHHQASTKWTNTDSLVKHVGTYSLVWFWASWFFLDSLLLAVFFSGITLLAHGVTDLITSKLAHDRFEEEDYHNGFVIVGADQILHYVQLLLTYELLR